MEDLTATLLDELLAARGRVSDVLDRLPAVVAVFRGQQHVAEYSNPLFEQLAAGEPLLGRPVAEVFTQPENRKFIDLLDSVYLTGEPFTGEEWRAVGGDGVERFFDFAFVPLRAARSGEVGGVMVHAGEVSRLVGARRHAEESERRFRLLVDANVVGVTISGTERVVEANDAWLAIVGRERAELEEGALSWRAVTPPEWTSTDDQVMERLLRQGWVEPYEKEDVRGDGRRVPVLISGVRLDRDPVRIVALV